MHSATSLATAAVILCVAVALELSPAAVEALVGIRQRGVEGGRGRAAVRQRRLRGARSAEGGELARPGLCVGAMGRGHEDEDTRARKLAQKMSEKMGGGSKVWSDRAADSSAKRKKRKEKTAFDDAAHRRAKGARVEASGGSLGGGEVDEGGDDLEPDVDQYEMNVLDEGEEWENKYRALLEQVFDSGLPPMLHTSQDASLTAATFVLPHLTQKGLSFKSVSCCGFAEVMSKEERTEYVPYCDCCMDKKLAFRSAQFYSDEPGGCDEYVSGEKSALCDHTRIMQLMIDRAGGMQAVLSKIPGTLCVLTRSCLLVVPALLMNGVFVQAASEFFLGCAVLCNLFLVLLSLVPSAFGSVRH